MDKVFSARLDEAAIDVMNRITRRLGISKKRFIEEAIRLRAQSAENVAGADVWAETAGVWKRSETVERTVRHSRSRFRNAWLRRHRGKGARLHR